MWLDLNSFLLMRVLLVVRFRVLGETPVFVRFVVSREGRSGAHKEQQSGKCNFLHGWNLARVARAG